MHAETVRSRKKDVKHLFARELQRGFGLKLCWNVSEKSSDVDCSLTTELGRFWLQRNVSWQVYFDVKI